MRPDPETNNAFIYCLAVSAQRFEIEVLFTVAMSNHHHTGIFDPHGNYPEFLEYFHKLFAKCQNTLRGRWENFWATEQTSMVQLTSKEDALSKLVYAIANPVKAQLVDHALEWPGVSSYSATLQDREMTATRPKHFFRSDGCMPDHASLKIVRPSGYRELSQQAWSSLVRERVTLDGRDAQRERNRKGLKTIGIRNVLRQSWQSRPKTKEVRRRLKPRVAARNRWRRVETLAANKLFLRQYSNARAAFRAGLQTVLFPKGTYWLKKFADVLCEQLPYEFAA